jgi:gamma-glutamyltranspeptidase/glutathione hydrolase
MTASDLAGYQPGVREPICRPYREYRVCAFGPPTSGGVAVLQILGVLEAFDVSALAPRSPEAIHLLADAQRLAYADRGRWIGDPDAVEVPVDGLLDAEYLSERAALVDLDSALADATAGTPPGAQLSWMARPSPERPSTSHMSIVDAKGNIVSMTTSIEAPFGSHLMVRGFLLNNQLTDFSFAAREEGRLVANAPGPGKRPRSSMSPVIVFDAKTNEPRFVVGSPGGARIIAYVAQTTVGLIDWDLAPQEAVELPRVVAQGGTIELERTGWPNEAERDRVVDTLEAMGHDVDVTMLHSGLHVIEIGAEQMRSGVDPRREGTALADG